MIIKKSVQCVPKIRFICRQEDGEILNTKFDPTTKQTGEAKYDG